MLVTRIKIGRAVNQHRHLAVGPVSYARRNQNAGVRLNTVFYAVEFNGCVFSTLQDHVNLCVIEVVMLLSITADLG